MSKIKMSFSSFSSMCRFFKFGCDIDHNLVETCRHPDNIPRGCSWGECKESVCPLLKKEDTNASSR